MRLAALALAGCAACVPLDANRLAEHITHETAETVRQAMDRRATRREQQGKVVPASSEQPAPAARLKLSGKLAVLELRNFSKDITRENAQYFTDVIRQASLRMEPGLDVMTRENLIVLLESSGKKLDECEGECEVDTGRRIGADSVVSGEIQRLGTKYKLSLRLHDTREGKLLSSSIASGGSVDELDASVHKAAEELFVAR